MLFKAARHTRVQIALAIIIVSSFLAVPVFAADYSCALVKRKAWPEHHHFSISKDEDGIQTLFALVRNFDTARTYEVKVMFRVAKAEYWGRRRFWPYEEVWTDLVMIGPGEELVLSIDLTGIYQDEDTGKIEVGKYYVLANCQYDGVWGESAKRFRFEVVP